MHKLSSNFCRCYPAWHRVSLFPSLTPENRGSPVQWVLNTASHPPVRNGVQGPQTDKKQPQSQLMGWFFSEPSPPLEEEGNLRLNVTVVTVAAWHRSQWNSTVSIQPSPRAGTYLELPLLFNPTLTHSSAFSSYHTDPLTHIHTHVLSTPALVACLS